MRNLIQAIVIEKLARTYDTICKHNSSSEAIVTTISNKIEELVTKLK